VLWESMNLGRACFADALSSERWSSLTTRDNQCKEVADVSGVFFFVFA